MKPDLKTWLPALVALALVALALNGIAPANDPPVPLQANEFRVTIERDGTVEEIIATKVDGLACDRPVPARPSEGVLTCEPLRIWRHATDTRLVDWWNDDSDSNATIRVAYLGSPHSDTEVIGYVFENARIRSYGLELVPPSMPFTRDLLGEQASFATDTMRIEYGVPI